MSVHSRWPLTGVAQGRYYCIQNMLRVYKHTGTDKDYDAYKEALNAATNEVRKSKQNCEHKFAQNIKSDSKNLYAYVRSNAPGCIL